jgi:hypothetical protein
LRKQNAVSAVSGPTGSEPPFDVWLTPEAAEDVRALRGQQAHAVKRARAELERIGCQAAHYRLSGAGVEHLCVLKLRDSFRMVLLFPAANEVAILLVGPHDRENPDLDVYCRLYEALGIEVPDAEHRRPACCEDGQPPVDLDLLEQLIDRAKELTRQKRRA